MLSKIKNVYQRIFLDTINYIKRKGVETAELYEIFTRYFGSELCLVEIGDHVQAERDFCFFNHRAVRIFRDELANVGYVGRTEVREDRCISSCALILSGVTTDSSGGAVVTKSVPAYALTGGDPVKGDTRELKDGIRVLDLKTKPLSYEAKSKLLITASRELFLKR